MTLSKMDVAYFPSSNEDSTTTSCVMLYGNMHFIARGVDTFEYRVLATALWKIPTSGDMSCLCPNTACTLRIEWQVEGFLHLMH